MSELPDMVCVIDVDWCDWECPCGAEICGNTRAFGAWLAEHAPHTSGYYRETATAKALDYGNPRPGRHALPGLDAAPEPKP